MPDPSQEPVLAFLANPATHHGASVTRIDTHAAAVFLAGPRALKIKRAVRFPFLDFSTLARRKAACDAELAINRAFAPDLYWRVVPITREANGELALGGHGAPVEWAVEMVRFDETQTLDRLAEAGRIDAALADALGRAAAKTHVAARPVAGFDFAAALSDIVGHNDSELRGFADLFDPAVVAALTQASHASLMRLTPLLDAREREGLVRRCHGDLHLGNIVLIENKPVPFDAIEFDERFATTDVLYDLAFLLMDLIARDLAPAASIALNRYLVETRRTSDLDALAALPLFMATRAAIRAKVSAARRAHASDAKAAADSARDYFALAQRLIVPPAPRLVAVGGLSGTGKSVLARALAAHLPPLPGAVVLRSDIERKQLFDVSETTRLPPAAYTAEVTERVYSALAEKALRILAAGHSVIVDAVFARGEERAAVEAAAGNAPFRGLFLTADLATRVARVGARAADASDADTAVARAQETYELGTLSWAEVDASGTPENTLRGALAALDSDAAMHEAR
jgi:aminoglycoside phosphotransferase family enzyme/predicted kinase